jgi:hypothetical protein
MPLCRGFGCPPVRTVLLASALASLLALAMAPHARGEDARLDATFPPTPFLPPGSETTLAGNLTYSYDARSANQTQVTLAASAQAPWLRARVDPALVSVAADQAGNATRVPIRLIVTIAPGAPALEQGTVSLRLEAQANPPVDAAFHSVGVPVRVAFAPALAVQPLAERTTTKPGEPVGVPLRLTNQGNGPVRVTFQAQGAPEGVVVLPPGPVLVEARGTLQERTLNLSVVADRPGEFPLVLRYASAHAFDPTLTGSSGEVRVVLVVEPAGLPGAAMPMAGLAALLAGLAARRKDPR